MRFASAERPSVLHEITRPGRSSRSFAPAPWSQRPNLLNRRLYLLRQFWRHLVSTAVPDNGRRPASLTGSQGRWQSGGGQTRVARRSRLAFNHSMRLCRFDAQRLGLVDGGAVRDVTQALDSLPAYRHPFPNFDLLVARL